MKLRLFILFATFGLAFISCEDNDEIIIDNPTEDTENPFIGTWDNINNDDIYSSGFTFTDSTFVFFEDEVGYTSERTGVYTYDDEKITLVVQPESGNDYTWEYYYTVKTDTIIFDDETYSLRKDIQEETESPFIGTWDNILNNDNYSSGYTFTDSTFTFFDDENGYTSERTGTYTFTDNVITMIVYPGTEDSYTWEYTYTVNTDTIIFDNEIYSLRKDIQEETESPFIGIWDNIENNDNYSSGFTFTDSRFTFFDDENGYTSERTGTYTFTDNVITMIVYPGTEDSYTWEYTYTVNTDTIIFDNEIYSLRKDIQEETESPFIGTWDNIENNDNYSSGFTFTDSRFTFFDDENGYTSERNGVYTYDDEKITLVVQPESENDYTWEYNYTIKTDTIIFDNETYSKR